MKKFVWMIALLLMAVPFFVFAGGSSEAESTTEEPLVWLTSVQGSTNPEGMTAFEEEVERLTGVKVSILRLGGSDFDNKLGAMLASGDKLDILYYNRLFQFYDEGFLEPLEERIEASPVLSDPSVIPASEWDRIRHTDGHIYGVFNKDETGIVPTVRGDWMEKLGIADPQSLEDYYQMFKAFKEQDPDGNGEDDTYGLAIGYSTYDLTPFFGAYGLKRGYIRKTDGSLDVPWATEAAVPVYEYMQKLYAEELLEPNFITNKSGDFRGLFMNDRVGMTIYWSAWVGLFNQKMDTDRPDSPFRARGLAPPEGPGGRLLRAGDDGLMAIPVVSQRKDDAFKVMEFWHTHEGNVLSTLGVLDYDYTLSTDGQYTLTEEGTRAAMDHGAPYPKSLKWENPFGFPEGFQEANELVLQYGEAQLPTAYERDWEEIVRSEAGNIIQGNISPAEGIQNMRDRFRDKGILK